MGDKVKSVDYRFLYNESLSAFDQAINTEKPYPIAIKDNNEFSQIFLKNIFEYNEVSARYSEIDSLTKKIKIQSNKLKLYQKKAFIISAQTKCVEGSKKFKLLIDLLICQDYIIELFPQIKKLTFNDKNFKYDCSDDNSQIYGGFKEKPLAQIIEDRNETKDQIQKMVENAEQMIIKLDQEILLDSQNHELYLEKIQQQLILAYQKQEQSQFMEELQNPFQTFQIALLNSKSQQKYILQKKLEFCEQIFKGLKKYSIEYLEILFMIMQIYDEQTKVNTESSQQISQLKFSTLRNEFKEEEDDLTSESVGILKKIFENCICSIKKLQNQSKKQQINNMCLEAKVYLIFAKVFTKNSTKPIENNIEFQIALDLYQEIICILNASQSEFSNQFEYLRFQLQIYKDLQAWIERDFEKIQFQQWICQIKEQICEISPSYEDLNRLSINKFKRVYELEDLLRLQKKEDVQIQNKIIVILDKILELDLNDKKALNNWRDYYERPFSKAVNHKLKLLLKLNRKLEALDMCKKLIQNKDINQIEEICFNLLIEQSNFREAQIICRLSSRMRSLYVCQTMKNNI